MEGHDFHQSGFGPGCIQQRKFSLSSDFFPLCPFRKTPSELSNGSSCNTSASSCLMPNSLVLTPKSLDLYSSWHGNAWCITSIQTNLLSCRAPPRLDRSELCTLLRSLVAASYLKPPANPIALLGRPDTFLCCSNPKLRSFIRSFWPVPKSRPSIRALSVQSYMRIH